MVGLNPPPNSSLLPSAFCLLPFRFNFGRVESHQVIVNFNGGTITSDAGLMLIAALDQKRLFTNRFAACFQDYRDQTRVEHSLPSLIAQRVYGLIQGYEDLNDQERRDVRRQKAEGKKGISMPSAKTGTSP